MKCSRPAIRRAPQAWLVVLGLSLASCYSPSYSSDCPFSCSTSSACPSGFACTGGICCRGGTMTDLWVWSGETGRWVLPEGGSRSDAERPDTRRPDSLTPLRSQLAWTCDTHEEWNAGTRVGTKIVGEGEPAYLAIDAVQAEKTGKTSAVKQEGGGQGWYHWDSAKNWIPDPSVLAGGTRIFSDLTPPAQGKNVSSNLVATGFGLALPADAGVRGVAVAISRFQSGTVDQLKDDNLQLVRNGAVIGQNRGRTGEYWSQRQRANIGTAYYGGATDRWDASLDAATVNSSTFGVSYRVRNHYSGSNASAWIGGIQLTVYFTNLAGEYTSQSITLDASAEGWDKIEVEETVPAACGADAALFNVLDSSNKRLLQSNLAGPLDLSGSKASPIRIWLRLRSVDAGCTPQIDKLEAYVLKR